MIDKKTKSLLINTISEKYSVKSEAQENTQQAFNMLKEVLHAFVKDYNKELQKSGIHLEYTDKGKSECELKIADDTLIFSMYSHVFEFNRDHHIWKKSYVKDNKWNSYCGIINIYNFLSDSFKLRRTEDLGYLIARIFVNKERHYFVEGKRQLGFLYNNFEDAVVNKEDLSKIIHSALLYSLEFDLLVPHYDNVKIISVAQIMEKIKNSKVQTGKRLGFSFTSDDVLEEK